MTSLRRTATELTLAARAAKLYLGVGLAGLALFSAVAQAQAATSHTTAAAAVPYASLATLHVKPQALAPFEASLRRNATAARAEPGNLSFTVFASQAAPDTLYVLEQWRDEAAYRRHLTQPALLAMHAQAKTALDGAIDHLRLIPATADAGLQPKQVAQAGTTSNVLVYLTVKPEQLARFHTDIAALTPTFRAAPGNLAFDIYQDADHPERMVQIERWTSDATHEANLKRPVIGQIRAGYALTLAKPMTDGRVLLNDITQQ